ncbi:hypothetical protein [Halomonas sp.]|uniref:hypothetical protein n=1 Tax=Halomonas sp. TaxID=1486246 RepID=UPI003D0F308A
MAETDNQQLWESEKRLFEAEHHLKYNLARFGDHIAKREKYRENQGIDAVRFYLMQKHAWTPAVVMAMSDEHLRFALSEEMAGWVLPREAILD